VNERTPAIERVDDGIVSFKLFSDENPYIDASFIPMLAKRVSDLNADTSIRAIVVEGGNRYFSAGASREALLATDPEIALIPMIAEIPRLILSLSAPTIAAMVGHAIGGGFLIGLWCDIVILAVESLYGINATALGITPVMGSSVILEEALGAPLARELLLAGRLVTGNEIKNGKGPLTYNILPHDEVRDHAFSIAREIADKPPKAVSLFKGALSAKRREILEQALTVEERMCEHLFGDGNVLGLIAELYPAGYARPSGGNHL